MYIKSRTLVDKVVCSIAVCCVIALGTFEIHAQLIAVECHECIENWTCTGLASSANCATGVLCVYDGQDTVSTTFANVYYDTMQARNPHWPCYGVCQNTSTICSNLYSLCNASNNTYRSVPCP